MYDEIWVEKGSMRSSDKFFDTSKVNFNDSGDFKDIYAGLKSSGFIKDVFEEFRSILN